MGAAVPAATDRGDSRTRLLSRPLTRCFSFFCPFAAAALSLVSAHLLDSPGGPQGPSPARRLLELLSTWESVPAGVPGVTGGTAGPEPWHAACSEPLGDLGGKAEDPCSPAASVPPRSRALAVGAGGTSPPFSPGEQRSPRTGALPPPSPVLKAGAPFPWLSSCKVLGGAHRPQNFRGTGRPAGSPTS